MCTLSHVHLLVVERVPELHGLYIRSNYTETRSVDTFIARPPFTNVT